MTPTNPEAVERLIVEQSDRDAVQAFHRIQIERIMRGDKTLGDDVGDAGVLVQAFARARLAEREACAALCDDVTFGTDIAEWMAMTKKGVSARACHECAAAIRARTLANGRASILTEPAPGGGS